MKGIKRIIPLFVAMLLVITAPTVVYGEGTVYYQGNAKKFVFSPGSEFSPSDLFSDFKEVMPGDKISQKIVVKNDASNDVKAKIYLRSLGSKEGSEDILSKIKLRVTQGEDAVLFDAAAGQKAQLEQWVLLGTLYSGGKAELNLDLDVAANLENDFQDSVGYLNWQFKVEELPVEPTDPIRPETGDRTEILIYAGVATVAIGVAISIILCSRRKKTSK